MKRKVKVAKVRYFGLDPDGRTFAVLDTGHRVYGVAGEAPNLLEALKLIDSIKGSTGGPASMVRNFKNIAILAIAKVEDAIAKEEGGGA